MGGVLSAIGLGDEEPNFQLTLETLKSSDASTTNALIGLLRNNETFINVAKADGDAILARDNEDAEKLVVGIKLAQAKGVLSTDAPTPYTQIQVLGKTPDEVSDEMIAALGEGFKGGVIVLVGLSGTGKGTTVEKLKSKLPNAVTWSNGNIFRSLTLLAATHCQQTTGQFDKACLTPENLATWMGMLSFGKYNGKWDTHICGLGLDLYVNDCCNTTLKGPLVRSNIPTVAEVTQGEVVKFASGACKQMGEDGITVLLEGRAQTVDHIDSPHRFELVLSDPTIIGMRRAAQRIGAKALELIGSATNEQSVIAAVALVRRGRGGVNHLERLGARAPRHVLFRQHPRH